MDLDGLSALIINSDLNGRSRLREVIKSCVYKAELKLVQTIKEASENLDIISEVDTVLVSFDVGEQNISDFIKSCKNQLDRACPTFIVTITKQNSNTTAKVTSLYLEGVAGFIAEPYSPDELTALLRIVKEQRDKIDNSLRNQKALKFLFFEASKRIDDLHKLHCGGDSKNGGGILKELKNISQSIQTLYKQDPELYSSILSDVFESIPAPAISSNTSRRKRSQKKELVHPGRVVADMMKQRNLTLERLTPSIKLDIKEFELFLLEKRGLDDELSREVSRLFGKTAKEWLKMQKEYDHAMELLQAKADTTKSA